MTLMAASGIASLAPFLLVLACPLLMVFMMRGMHGGGHAGDRHHSHNASPKPADEMSLDELKAERDALNEEIGRRAEQRHPACHRVRAAIPPLGILKKADANRTERR